MSATADGNLTAADNGEPQMLFARDWDVFDVAVRLQAMNNRNKRYYCVSVHGKELRLAKSSMYCFREDAKPWLAKTRYYAVWISEWKVFERFIYLVILAYCLALSHPVSYDPQYGGEGFKQAMESFNLVSNFIFLFELIVKMIARGVFLSDAPDPCFLREATNWLDLFVVCTGVMEMAASGVAGLDPKQAVIFRVFRVLRALRTMSAMPDLKNIVTALLESLVRMVQWMGLLCCLFITFVILGGSMFGTDNWQRCRLTPAPIINTTSNVTYWPLDTNQSRFCGGLYTCEDTALGAPTYCGGPVTRAQGALYAPWAELEESPSGDYGYTGFQSFSSALLTVFQVATMEGWTIVLQRYRDSSGEIATLFFSVIILFGGLVLMNLVVAILWERFDIMQRERMRADAPLRRKFDTRPKLPQDIVDMKLPVLMIKVAKLEEEQKLTADFRKLDTVDRKMGLKNICYSITANPRFNLFMLGVITINAFALATDCHPPLNILVVEVVELINFFCTIAFMVEVCLKILGMGINFFTDDFNVFDLFLVCVSSIEMMGLQGENAMAALRTARLLRLFKMMRLQVSMRVLFSVLVKAVKPSYNFCLIISLCVYVFALVGLQLLFTSGPIEGTQLGFRDIYQAMVTVLTFLSTDDWFTNMMIFIRKGPAKVTSMVFFLSGIIVLHYIFMSLFLAIFASAFAQARNELVGDQRQKLHALRVEAAQIAHAEAAENAKEEAAAKAAKEAAEAAAAAAAEAAAQGSPNAHVYHEECATSPRWPPPSAASDDTLPRFVSPTPMNLLLMFELKRRAALRQTDAGGEICLNLGHVEGPASLEATLSPSRDLDSETDHKTPIRKCFAVQHAGMPPPVVGTAGNDSVRDGFDGGSSARSSSSRFRERLQQARESLGARNLASSASACVASPCTSSPFTSPMASVSNTKPTIDVGSILEGCGSMEVSSPCRIEQAAPASEARMPKLRVSVAGRVRDVIQTSAPGVHGPSGSVMVEKASANATESRWRLGAREDVEASVRIPISYVTSGIHRAAPVHDLGALPAKGEELTEYELEMSDENHGALFLASEVEAEELKHQVPVTGVRAWLSPKRIARRIAAARLFEPTAIFLILVSSVVLALEDPYQHPDGPVIRTIVPINTFLVFAFLFEMTVKLLAHGAWEYGADFRRGDEKPYFRVGWNWIDFIGVLSGTLDFVLAMASDGQSSWRVIRAVRLLRILRMLRVIKTNKGMRLVIDCLIASVPTLANMVLIACLIYAGFAILFVNMMKGALMYCSLDPHGNTRPDIDTKQDCLNAGGEWLNAKSHFDHVGASLLTLLHVGIGGEGWIDVMVATSNARKIDFAPRPFFSPIMGLMVVAFVLLTNFFLLNLFIGVLVDQYGVSRGDYDDVDVLSTIERRWKMLQREIVLDPDFWRSSRWKILKGGVMRRILDSSPFSYTMTLLAAGSLVPFLLDQPVQDQDFRVQVRTTSLIFEGIFVLEAIVKLLVYRLQFTKDQKLRDMLLIFDGIVALGLLASALVELYADGNGGWLGICLRIFIFGRVLRLTRAFKFMRIMAWLVMNLIEGLTNVAGLLFLMLFMYSCLGVGLFGTMAHGSFLGPVAHFENVPSAMMLLFGAATGEKWHYLMYDVMTDQPGCTVEAQPIEELLDPAMGPNGCGMPVFGVWYFTTFVLTIRIVVMNLIIAIILDGFTYVDDIDSSESIAKQVRQVRQLWRKDDPQLDGVLPLDAVVDILREIDEPVGVCGHSKRMAMLHMKSIALTNDQMVHISDLAKWCAKRTRIWLIGGYTEDVPNVKLDSDVLARWEVSFAGRANLVAKGYYDRQYTVAHAVIAREIGDLYKIKLKRRKSRDVRRSVNSQQVSQRKAARVSEACAAIGEMQPMSPMGQMYRAQQDRQWDLLLGSGEKAFEESDWLRDDWLREEQQRLEERSPKHLKPTSPLPWPPVPTSPQLPAKDTKRQSYQEFLASSS